MPRLTTSLVTSFRRLAPIGVLLVLTVLGAASVAAQTGGGTAGVGGLRAYWHVFIAYAIVILLVLGWVI